ncbi:hypothetical protein BDW74DRAFT_175157 [Aspergillus multicolor]|uniref:RTA1 domain-containing protein n=1 Tax=Aspergillus multicolor TaxID=41759 RepID=UPI003CCCB7A7
MSLPAGLITFGPDANCTLDLCPLEASILQYQPSIPANSVPIAIFGLSLLLNIGQGIYHHTWGFMVSLVLGCALEIAGYIGRLKLHDNPFDFVGFVMNIVAPVFFCAAIYVLLSRTINHINPHLSRIKPNLLYWVFIPCDIISLLLQAIGGGLSCIGETQDDIQLGVDVSLAGLIFQVITLSAFIVVFADYLYAAAKCRSTRKTKLAAKRMKLFLLFLFAAIFLVLIRCVYRVVELKEGYFSELFRDEVLFVALETGIMCAAGLCLNVGHPGLVFGKRRGKEDARYRPCATRPDSGCSMARLDGSRARMESC